MSKPWIKLDRNSVLDAVADYILQVNYKGYSPDYRKVLAVRETDRTAWLRNAAPPVRREVYYFVEGELFPKPETTKLAPGQSHTDLAEILVTAIWNDLWVWNAYDFNLRSGGLEDTRQFYGQPLHEELSR